MKVCRSGTSDGIAARRAPPGACARRLASSRTSSSDGVSSRSTATAIQHLVRVAELHAPLGHQHREVVEHVRRLLGQALVALLARGARDLVGLLPDLLPDELAVGEEPGGVAVLRSGVPALGDRALERRERLARDRLELAVVEARARPGVAGRARRLDQRENRVLVAVEAELLQALDVARGGALVPQLLARARPEPHLARLARALERLVVHVREREHLAGAGVLDYAGQKLHSVIIAPRGILPRALRSGGDLRSP